MLLRGEGLLAYRGPVVGGRLPEGLADLSELVGEARRPVRHPGHVRPDQDLTVAARARADADQIIMAAGTFVQGASIELSADGPMREPYCIYLQGGLTFEHAALGVMAAAEAIL